MPTTVSQGASSLSPAILTRLPSASSLGQNFRAIASLMRITWGALKSSCAVNSRPDTSPTPSVFMMFGHATL